MKYVEAKIDGNWIIVDGINSEDSTFIIYDENGDENAFQMSEHEMRIVRYETEVQHAHYLKKKRRVRNEGRL